MNYKRLQELCRKNLSAYWGCSLKETDDTLFEDIEKGTVGKGEGDNFKYLLEDYEIMLVNLFKFSTNGFKEFRQQNDERDELITLLTAKINQLNGIKIELPAALCQDNLSDLDIFSAIQQMKEMKKMRHKK
jgi:hypothetical protein